MTSREHARRLMLILLSSEGAGGVDAGTGDDAGAGRPGAGRPGRPRRRRARRRPPREPRHRDRIGGPPDERAGRGAHVDV